MISQEVLEEVGVDEEVAAAEDTTMTGEDDTMMKAVEGDRTQTVAIRPLPLRLKALLQSQRLKLLRKMAGAPSRSRRRTIVAATQGRVRLHPNCRHKTTHSKLVGSNLSELPTCM
jgi:hypothetical protein